MRWQVNYNLGALKLCAYSYEKLLRVFARQLLQRREPHASRLNGGNPRTALAPQRTGLSLRDIKSALLLSSKI
ncbi:hypothetical protein [Scytonema millei]|uniref:Uncharacterized protein n=1 Tax=Scytonema millei VB511283 TaxID=1245923 RepID=A0A9X5E2W7_9CYAN|nr:hypothetical protein [Scytonema millei]NHC34072.1 hypothetical protein [Scytonema millei VB511283]